MTEDADYLDRLSELDITPTGEGRVFVLEARGERIGPAGAAALAIQLAMMGMEVTISAVESEGAERGSG